MVSTLEIEILLDIFFLKSWAIIWATAPKRNKQTKDYENSLKKIFQINTSQKDTSKKQNFLSATYLWQYDMQTNIFTSELLDIFASVAHFMLNL